MPISVACVCGRSLRAKDELAGRRVRCPGCGGAVVVPHPQSVGDEEIVELFSADAGPANPPPRPLPPPTPVVSADEVRRRAPAPPFSDTPPPEARPKARRKAKAKKRTTTRTHSGFGIAVHPSIIGGVLMMVGAVVWFVVGLAAGWVFYYPPILFVLGIVAVVRGFKGSE